MSSTTHDPVHAQLPYEPIYRAERHLMALPAQIPGHLPVAIHFFRRALQITQPILQIGIGDIAVGWWPSPGFAVGPWRNLHSVCSQHTADRLDAMTLRYWSTNPTINGVAGRVPREKS